MKAQALSLRDYFQAGRFLGAGWRAENILTSHCAQRGGGQKLFFPLVCNSRLRAARLNECI